MDELTQWLSALHLEHYAEAFEREEYDSMDVIKQLTNIQVDEMIECVELTDSDAATVRNNLDSKAFLTGDKGGINYADEEIEIENEEGGFLDQDDKFMIDECLKSGLQPQKNCKHI